MTTKSLKEQRLTRGLSHRALAERAGVSTKTLSDVELGKVAPKLRTIKRVSDALGVEPMDVSEFRAVIEGELRADRTHERPEA